MKNITLSADEELINQARQQALRENRTLNSVFREWLSEYARRGKLHTNYKQIMERLSYADAGRHFNREELHER
jgi:predicted transcriptional regulator